MSDHQPTREMSSSSIPHSFSSPYTFDCLIAQGGMSSIFRPDPTNNVYHKVIKIAPLPGVDQQLHHPVMIQYHGKGEIEVNGQRHMLSRRQLQALRYTTHESLALGELRKAPPEVTIARDIRNYIAEWHYYEGHLCFILELEAVPGIMVRAMKPLYPPDAGKIISDIARVLDVLQRYGIVHRDLKPDNIIYTPAQEPGRGQAHLIDFGLARKEEGYFHDIYVLPWDFSILLEDQTLESSVVGTIGYYSPEQIRREPLTTASDVFVVGLVAYELLMSEQVFRSLRSTELEQFLDVEGQVQQYNNKQRDYLVQKMRTHKIPPDLSEAIGNVLDKNPESRNLSLLEHAALQLSFGK